MKERNLGALAGIGAAALFGLSAPLAKALLRDVNPVVLAALLYVGAALALGLVQLIVGGKRREAPLRRADIGPMVIVALLGGVLGPLLTHEHVHVHDVHHDHAHTPGAIEPHSHVHTHDELTHEHAHGEDSHHRHPHR